jgi:hypothetical protein
MHKITIDLTRPTTSAPRGFDVVNDIDVTTFTNVITTYSARPTSETSISFFDKDDNVILEVRMTYDAYAMLEKAMDTRRFIKMD